MADEDLTAGQRAALAALAATRGHCPSSDALVEYEALTEDERRAQPIHAHVQVCSRCQLVLLNLDEAEPVGLRSHTRWALPLAAVLAIAVAGAVVYRSLPQETVVESVRGTELQPIAPAGNVEALAGFRWQSPIRAAKYRVTVFKGTQTVWTGETVQTDLPTPTVALDRGVYEWQVEALDAEGVVRMSSPRTRFTVTR